MKSQRFKDTYATIIRPTTRICHEYWKYSLQHSIPRSLRRGEDAQVWINLGSGAKPFPFFVNIDINVARHPDMWLDLRNGLPFPTQSVHRIYTCHVLEHFFWDELTPILAECFRVLKPDGGLRMLVPSVELAVAAYTRGDSEWFSTFPRAHTSLGGRFSNFLFCDGQHRVAFDNSLAVELLTGVGFRVITQGNGRSSQLFPASIMPAIEPTPGTVDISLIVEAKKVIV